MPQVLRRLRRRSSWRAGTLAALLLLAVAPALVTLPRATPRPAQPITPATDPLATGACDCQRFVLPIYPSNTPEWDRAVASDLPPGSILILNLGGTRAGDDPYREKGGPGPVFDPDMLRRVRAAQERGYLVIGYIRTGATGSNAGPRRDRAYTDREINDLVDWYDVDGIFYDEVYADWDYYPYYAELVAYGRSVVPGLHVMNLGGHPSKEYTMLGDIIGTFEGTVEDFATWSIDPWQRALPPSRWGIAVMKVTDAEQMAAVLRRARTQNIGYIYTTDLFGTSTENPWTRLPPYWPEQVAEVQGCWEVWAQLERSSVWAT